MGPGVSFGMIRCRYWMLIVRLAWFSGTSGLNTPVRRAGHARTTDEKSR